MPTGSTRLRRISDDPFRLVLAKVPLLRTYSTTKCTQMRNFGASERPGVMAVPGARAKCGRKGPSAGGHPRAYESLAVLEDALEELVDESLLPDDSLVELDSPELLALLVAEVALVAPLPRMSVL